MLWRKIIGIVRAWFGACPHCASRSPLMEVCPICHGWARDSEAVIPFPSSEKIDEWMIRFDSLLAVEMIAGLLRELTPVDEMRLAQHMLADAENKSHREEQSC